MSVTNYWQTFQQNRCNHQGGAGHEPPYPMPPHFRALVSPLCNFRSVGCPANAGVVSCPWIWLNAVWAEAQVGTASCSLGTMLIQICWWWTGAISTGPEQAMSWWYTTKNSCSALQRLLPLQFSPLAPWPGQWGTWASGCPSAHPLALKEQECLLKSSSSSILFSNIVLGTVPTAFLLVASWPHVSFLCVG